MPEQKLIPCRTVTVKNNRYINIDDMIAWLRDTQSKVQDKRALHFLISSLIRMKNKK